MNLTALKALLSTRRIAIRFFRYVGNDPDEPLVKKTPRKTMMFLWRFDGERRCSTCFVDLPDWLVNNYRWMRLERWLNKLFEVKP